MNDVPQTPEEPAEPAAAGERVAALESELAAARREGLAHLRRALLAEHAGGLVPELVTGDTAEDLEASVAVASAAFETAREAALTELRREQAAAAGSGPAGPAAAPSTLVAATPTRTPASTPAAASVPAATPARDLVEPEPRSPLQRIAAGLGRQY